MGEYIVKKADSVIGIQGSLFYGKKKYTHKDGNPALWIYRSVFSEQISAECAFDLSCSNFSSRAFRTQNFFKALMLTADRLTRCHPSASEEVTPLLLNNKTGKVTDEPEMY